MSLLEHTPIGGETLNERNPVETRKQYDECEARGPIKAEVSECESGCPIAYDVHDKEEEAPAVKVEANKGDYYDPQTNSHQYWAWVENRRGDKVIVSADSQAGLERGVERLDDIAKILLIVKGQRINFMETRRLELG